MPRLREREHIHSSGFTGISDEADARRTFTVAAVDTTSSALSLILHLLSQHPDVQEKVREEILAAGDGKDIAYDELVSLPYLDAVCRETLRV